jgi:hypothetical protein
MTQDNIFISIASYRDDQTGPTIKDALNKAKFPNNITFGICLQHDTNEIDLSDIKHESLKILEYHWKNSQGTCWARHIIQKQLLSNEKYYLQLDSHHRFTENWDEWLINTYEELKQKYNKPIIGGYCPSYDANNDSILKDRPLQTNCNPGFTDSGDLFFNSKTINNFEKLREQNEKTITARFLSGHFIFTNTNFCKECVYDPNLYFRGEELSLSARAFTYGYDFFHPLYPIVWHEYIRRNKPKHWNDHVSDNGFVITAKDRSDKAKEKTRLLLGIQKSNTNFGKYGLGKNRSLHEYELYAGLNFKTQQIHKYAYNLLGKYPDPYMMTEKEWLDGLMKKYKVLIQIPQSHIKLLLDLQPEYISILCENLVGLPIYKKDIQNLDVLKSGYNDYSIEDGMEGQPSKIYLCPYITGKGYGEKLLINNFTIK